MMKYHSKFERHVDCVAIEPDRYVITGRAAHVITDNMRLVPGYRTSLLAYDGIKNLIGRKLYELNRHKFDNPGERDTQIDY